MKKIPIEVLSNVFKYLSQKPLFTSSKVCKQWYEIIYQPIYFSIIVIQSKHQLDRFIQFAITKIVHGKPIGHYVSHINFAIPTTFIMEQIELIISTFPNIQSINGLYKYIDSTTTSFYIPIPQSLTHISYWVTEKNIEWMKDLFNNENSNERIIKSIELDMDIDRFYHVDSYSKSPLPIIYTKNKPLDHQSTKTTNPVLLLILPKLNHLTHLKIDFPKIEGLISTENNTIDEHTLENIHESCPQLENLELKDFSFNITNNFNSTIMKNNNDSSNIFKPAYSLKELIVRSEFIVSNCYIYLSKKYPQIESLTLNLSVIPILKPDSEAYKQAIFNMLNQFHRLKKMNIYLYGSNINIMDKEHYPNNEFIQWLLHHPTQITNLTYHNKIIKKWNYDTESVNNCMMNQNIGIIFPTTNHSAVQEKTYESIINNMVHQHEFLNYLTYLSLTGDYLTDILYSYLLQKDHPSIILSTSIKELAISNMNQYDCINFVFIHNYLDVFPNLNSLQLRHCTVMNNKNDFYNYKRTGVYNSNIIKLYDLINQRKQHYELNSSNRKQIYNLRNLTFENCTIFMKNGLNDLFEKTPFINVLKLNQIRYSKEKLNLNDTDDFINLSSSSLETLHIIQFFYMPWSFNTDSMFDRGILTKLTLTETTFDKKIIIMSSSSSPLPQSSNSQFRSFFNLNLTCQYINYIVFESP